MGRLVAQFKIMAKPVLSSLAPSLFRLGFVLLGVIIGLLWAYQGAPVKFYDAEPVHLADGYKDQWIKMAAAELAESNNTAEARNHLIDAGISPAMIQDVMNKNPQLAGQLQPLLDLSQDKGIRSKASSQADKVQRSALGGALGPLTCILGTLIFGIILALLFTFYWAVPVGKWAKGAPRPAGTPGGAAAGTHAARMDAQRSVADQRTDFAAVGETAPVSQYMSTYILGDDLYDDSFSIETASGDFLGECGSGISETIGVGDPKKVTATEVWLFDKNDIRTVTKVLMSDHAFNDQALRTKLAPKGEAVLAEPGGVTILETQTLRVQVRIVDLQYGEGSLPAKSFLERLTVEIAAWPKEASGGAVPAKPDTTTGAFGDTAELLNY